MATTSITPKEDLRRRVQGLSSYEAQQVLAFIDTLGQHEPNEETIAALEEAEALLKDPNAKRYASFADLLREINDEEL